MKQDAILETIRECVYLSEMSYCPEVAFFADEDGDTRFLDDGSFVIYDIKTNLKAENFKKITARPCDYRGGPYIKFSLADGRVLTLTHTTISYADVQAFIEELKQSYGGVPVQYEPTMDEQEVLELIQECSCMTEMDYTPLVAFSEYEDGDTRFDEEGFLILYDVRTSLRAEDFLTIRYKQNDQFTRDPYLAFQLTGERYMELRCVVGDMRSADYDKFIKTLIEEYGGIELARNDVSD